MVSLSLLKDVEEVTIQFERGTLSSNKLKRQKNRRNFLGTRDSFFTILTKLFFLSHDSFVSRVNVKLVLFNWVRGFFSIECVSAHGGDASGKVME